MMPLLAPHLMLAPHHVAMGRHSRYAAAAVRLSCPLQRPTHLLLAPALMPCRGMSFGTTEGKAVSTLLGKTNITNVPVPAGSYLAAIRGVEQTYGPSGSTSLAQLQFMFGKFA